MNKKHRIDVDGSYAWFEVWVEELSTPPYVLILLGDDARGLFDICQPGNTTILHSASSYEEAMFWLCEDEYTKVDGRMSLD